MRIRRGGGSLTRNQAADRLGVKVAEVVDAGGMMLAGADGKTVELPWCRMRTGVEYVWRNTIAENGLAFEESIWVVAGTHDAAPGSLQLPEFDPTTRSPDNPSWPHRDRGVGPDHNHPTRITEVY